MRGLLAAALLGMLALPARADVVDAGNLSIGGQGIIGGTMTVQGAAFSIGGSTLAVAGGRVGVGTASPAVALHVAGESKFTSTVTIGPTAYSTTMTLTSGLLVNGWTIVASTNPGAATSILFTGLEPGKIYKMYGNLRQNSSTGQLQMRFNGDTGANYSWGIHGEAGGGGVNAGVTTASLILLNDTNGASSGYIVNFEELIMTDPSNQNFVTVFGKLVDNRGANGNFEGLSNRGTYLGASPLTSMTLLTSAGDFTGKVWIMQLTVPPGL